LQNQAEVDGFSGIFTTTVWQDTDVRTAFVGQLILRSLVSLAGLIGLLAVIVWFGVRVGLRPLLDLQDAIERRSSDELSPIQRRVPAEVGGIVNTLNRLFAQVSRSMTAQSEFLSNAAHQLRNPIAGVLSLAEAVHAAPSAQEAKRRSADLLAAAQETADLSQKLLLMERAKAATPAAAQDVLDLAADMGRWHSGLSATVPRDIRFALDLPEAVSQITGDATMLREAVTNLIDNAVRHGGADLKEVHVSLTDLGDHLELTVQDDGQGIPPDHLPAATERFRQLSPTSSSGLGLSIVEAVAHGHGGTLVLSDACLLYTSPSPRD